MRKYITVRNVEMHVGFLIMFVVILLLSSVLAVVYYTKIIDHQASIVTDGMIQAYLDQECTQVLDSQDWGDFNVSLGDALQTLDFYLRNEGNVAVNVTWTASGFTFYNGTAVQFQTSSWKLYLAKVDGSEVKLKPENDTAPDKVHLTAGQAAHLKFYLTAIGNSPPVDFNFQTSFKSKDN